MTLSHEAHRTPDEGRCAMEWIAHLSGQQHTDSPAGVSPMLVQFCVALNDALPEDQRQRLRPYLARTIGTAGDGLDESRRWLCADWVSREYLPTWLETVPALTADAAALRSLHPLLAGQDIARAMTTLMPARDRAVAAWETTWDGAWDNAWIAARDAARAALRVAASDAARDAVNTLSFALAWEAVSDAGKAAGRVAAWVAARDAAWGVAWDVVPEAVTAAAREALASTTQALVDSVLGAGGLLDRLLPTEQLVSVSVGPAVASAWATGLV